MPFATDEEIKIAHDILLKGKKPFDQSRVDILKENSSCYVQACPGSGKTTALLAKLIILANKMPLADGQGVCVLTHTNVAIDEIKAKVGQKAEVLFRYPNFFGTIQTFLHKYIASAALHYFYGSQITYVDNDVANAVFLKKYNKLPIRESKLKKLIYARTVAKENLIKEKEIEALGGVDMLTAAKVIERKGKRVFRYNFKLQGYDWNKIPNNFKSFICAKKDYILDSEGKELILSFKVDWENNKIVTDQSPIGITTDSGAEYMRIKEEMFKEGILSFQDAYDLAFRYIREKSLDFSNFSDKRFKYLFIDEVQDCDSQQVELIKKVFADDKVVVQRFGDYCQAIYDGEGFEGANNDELKDGQVLYIRNSNRFGEAIAKPLRSLCMEDNRLLVGNDEIPSVKAVIITYENPTAVLPKYIDLLSSTKVSEMDNLSVLEIANKERLEDPLHRINIKACGWVGRKGADEQKRFIESYFPSFERKKGKPKIEGNSFDDFILKKSNITVKDYVTSIIQGILKFLDLSDIKNGTRRHTRTSFLEQFSAKDIDRKEDFLNKIMNWSLLMVKGNGDEICNIKEAIYQYIISVILPYFGKEVTKDAKNFFDANGEELNDDQFDERGNIYHGDGIEVEVATIHAVKGETHVSTLYLETSYYGQHESERLAEQFKGVPYTGVDKRTLSNLRVAYVGMSRPRYLLCVAMQKDRFDKIDCRELREIWNVHKA